MEGSMHAGFHISLVLCCSRPYRLARSLRYHQACCSLCSLRDIWEDADLVRSNYGLGSRQNALLSFLGKGILTQEGHAWKHSRELLRSLIRTHAVLEPTRIL